MILLIVCIVVGAISIKIWRTVTTETCTSISRLDGKTVLITGGNAGIGKGTAIEIAKRGARLIIASRNVEKSKKVRAEIIEKTQNSNVDVRHLDFESLESVRKFCSEFLATESRLDVLINNAGCMVSGGMLTKEGNEVGMQVNHLGPFLLTNLLLDLMKSSAPSRIVILSSAAHKIGDLRLNPQNLNDLPKFSPKFCSEFILYAVTKLCNMLMVKVLAIQLQGTGVTVNAVHPGIVRTEIFTDLPSICKTLGPILAWPFVLNTYQGAQTSVHVAISEKLEGVSGQYFENCKVAEKSEMADDEETAKTVWEMSWKLVENKTN